MANTTNYNWETPDDTDLVKDGAAAIRTLGSSIDTTTKNLNPQTTTGALAYRSATANVNTALPIGTANQVLRVNSGGTAPEWATTADQTPLTTKGDLFGFDTADARIPIGTNGHILTADSTQSLGLKWAASASALNLITSTTFSSASSVSFPNDTFSSTYLAYKVLFVVESGTGGAVFSARLRTSGTDNSNASYYASLNGVDEVGTARQVVSNGATSINLGILNATNNTPFFTFDIQNPKASKRTDFAGSSDGWTQSGGNAACYGTFGGFFNATTSFDAMSFILATGSMSGYYKIYGYQN